MSLKYVRHGMCCAAMGLVLSVVLSGLSACSTAPRQDDAAAKLAMQEQVNEHLAAADKALQSGNVDQAMAQLDLATKADPASKAPWLKRAQIHFDARQYGQAITEAQEVLQRDVNDLTAKSILAVSGLRVSAAALEQLRKLNEVNGSTRSEAENVAKLIHEALGEPILVNTPAAAASEPASKPVKRAYPRTAVAPKTNVGGSTSPATPTIKSTSAATTTGAAGGRSNPFGALQ